MTIERAGLAIDRKLGEGGQGIVYALNNDPNLAYKEYNERTLPFVQREALSELIGLKEKIFLEGKPIRYWAAWPLDLVEDAGQVVGLIMPRIQMEFYFDSGGLAGRERSFMYLTSSAPKPAWGEVSLPNKEDQVLLLERFAGVLQQLHHRKIVVGDISYANVLWAAPGRVFLLDCDSFAIDGKTITGAKPSTEGWEDNLSAGLPMTPDQDNFKLGLLVYRVLANSLHGRPSAALRGDELILQDPDKAAAIADKLRLLSAAPGGRPTAQAVRHALQGRLSRLVAPSRPTVSPMTPTPEPLERLWRPIESEHIQSAAEQPEAHMPNLDREWRSVAKPAQVDAARSEADPPKQERQWRPLK